MSEQEFWERVFIENAKRGEGVSWSANRADEALEKWRERWSKQGNSTNGPYRNFEGR